MKTQRKLVAVGLVLIWALSMEACNPPPKFISGEITITPEFQKQIRPQAALYVIARKEGALTGAPIAVRRYTQPLSFPIRFRLTPEDRMISGIPFEGKMSISARIAQSGSASPARKGDLEGKGNPEVVEIGHQSLKIEINKPLNF